MHCNPPPGLSWRPSVCSNMAMGMPTFLERPATTTFFPSVGIPERIQTSKGLLRRISILRGRWWYTVTPLTCAFNNFPDSPGSCREHGGLIQAHAAHIHNVEAIHILGWRNCIADYALINVVWMKTRTSCCQYNEISNT